MSPYKKLFYASALLINVAFSILKVPFITVVSSVSKSLSITIYLFITVLNHTTIQILLAHLLPEY